MSDLTSTIDTHLSAWGEQDPAARAEPAERVWEDGGRLVRPPVAATGRAGISGLHAALRGRYAGHTYRRVSAEPAA